MRLLRTEIRKLEQKIDMDEKMKKMGDMQLSTVTDGKKRKTILEQVGSGSTENDSFCCDCDPNMNQMRPTSDLSFSHPETSTISASKTQHHLDTIFLC